MKAKALLSAITGFFFGLITYFLLQYLEMDGALLISVFGGLLFYILLFVFLLIYGKIMDKKHAEFEKEITKKFTFEERKAMNLYSLDNYCIFIASRYFDSLDDHINLVKVSKRMRGNMEKFHYNPISVDSKSVKLFPNVETLHLYEERDEYLEGGRIQRYVDWYRKVPYYELEEIQKENEGKEIKFK